MGWLFAFLFLVVAVTACIVLAGVWHDKVALQARLAIREEQVAALEADVSAKASIQVERDKLLAAYTKLSKRMQGVVDADAEKAKVLAEASQMAERFNAQLAAAKANYAAAKKQRDEELATLESQLAPLRSEHNALSEEASLVEAGFYKAHYGFATSERYGRVTCPP
jgi:hypothetical protein